MQAKVNKLNQLSEKIDINELVASIDKKIEELDKEMAENEKKEI